MPEVYAEFQRIGEQLEKHYRDVQDLEFTIERGKLYMLQTRSAKRTAAAAVKIAVDMVEEGIDHEGGGASPGSSRPTSTSSSRDQFDPDALEGRDARSSTGLNASPGAAVGRAVFDADTAVEWVGRGEKVDPRPDRDVARRLPRHGRRPGHPHRPRRRHLATRRSSPARSASRASPARADLLVDYAGKQAHCNVTGTEFKEGDWVSLDGSTGEVFLGALPTVEARFEDQPELQTILGWADEIRRMGVWTNADKPEEAAQARSYGAQGIGLCRTEHMFREGERLEIVRGAILVAMQATRAKAKAAAGEHARPPTSPRRSRRSTPRWPSSRSSSRATSRASSGRWTACRSSSA